MLLSLVLSDISLHNVGTNLKKQFEETIKISLIFRRLEAELVYSKSLSKMASKLNKACREIPGSLAEAWRAAATEIESRSEVHRQFSKSLGEEIVKPLKEILDGQHKTRKTVCEYVNCLWTGFNHAFNYNFCSLGSSRVLLFSIIGRNNSIIDVVLGQQLTRHRVNSVNNNNT